MWAFIATQQQRSITNDKTRIYGSGAILFRQTYSTESPAGSALSLVLDRCDVSLLSPVDSVGQVGEVSRWQVLRTISRGFLNFFVSIHLHVHLKDVLKSNHSTLLTNMPIERILWSLYQFGCTMFSKKKLIAQGSPFCFWQISHRILWDGINWP